MQLESVTAELRPRSDWEAVDLGIVLARRDFPRVLACWWGGMLPAIAVALPFLYQHPFWLLVVLWWWTPVSSRLVLFYLSRHLFGERPSRKNILRELPRAMIRRFGFRMLWARFSPWRPLTMAVEDLEGLRGKIYTQRVRLLMRRGDSTLIMVALWRVAISFGLTISMFALAIMILPEGESTRWKEVSSAWFSGGWEEPSLLIEFVIVTTLLISMSLTDIFATGIGFGVYVNHRTWIEGWDVEIALRRLGNRLRSLVTVLIAGAVLLLAGTSTAHAAAASPPRQTPGDVIKEIKAQPDFEVQKVTLRIPNKAPSGFEGFGGLLGALGTALGGLVLVGGIAFLVFLCWKFRHIFARSGVKKLPAQGPPAPTVVMGMAVTPESLPKDIPTRAWELWQAGQRQESLSLLYRGAISRLIDVVQVEIAESDTESDCLRRVSDTAPVHGPYFSTLTREWMRLAYGREMPAENEVRTLCQTWPFNPERRQG